MPNKDQLNTSKAPEVFDEQVHDNNYVLNELKSLISTQNGPTRTTPFGAEKTAEVDIQVSIDPSFGLNKQRFGWYSNGNFLDDANITEEKGKLLLSTSATSDDSVRLRSAYPGQYIAHTVSEPGLGATIPEKHLEFADDGTVSLTHGEISLEIAQWSDTNQRALNAHGISFESDATYAQVRAGDQNVAFVPQENWNIDTLDGSGDAGNPSGKQLRPQDGYTYLFIYSWYGEGAYILAVADPASGKVLPMHWYVPDQNSDSVHSPNMPVQATVENQGTADPLECRVGGMSYITHGSRKAGIGVGTRSVEEARSTATGFIDTPAVFNNEAVDPLAEPGVPLIAVRRDTDQIRFEKALRMEIVDIFANVDSNIYVFVFDEYGDANANINGTFNRPTSTGMSGDETGLETNTDLTTYSPSRAEVRGVTFISSSKNSAVTVTGDSSSRVPLQATSVVTAALAPGANSTAAQPFVATIVEGF